MKLYTLLTLALLSTVGCNGVNRLLGQEPHGSMPSQNNVDVNDYTVSGTTTKDHQSVYMPVTGRTITIEVLTPGASSWVALTRPDKYDAFDEYQIFTIPQEGVYFGDKAEVINGALYLYSGTPAAPKGTLYRIRNQKGN